MNYVQTREGAARFGHTAVRTVTGIDFDMVPVQAVATEAYQSAAQAVS